MDQKQTLNPHEPVWQDRKRILGMPITFTKYAITADRLVLNKGFLNTETDELLLYRIMDIKQTRSLGQKLFGVGTLTLYSADKSHSTLKLQNIKNVDGVRRMLSQMVEHARTEKRISGREIYGTGGFPLEDLDGDGLPG